MPVLSLQSALHCWLRRLACGFWWLRRPACAFRTLHLHPCFAALLLPCLLTACNTPAPSRASQPPRAASSGPSAALLNSQPISTASLTPALMELAGAQALEEAALDRLLVDALANAGLSISQDAIAAEEKLLLLSIASETGASADDASRLLTQLRARRGLGPTRYPAQLRRTASLRALVQSSAAPTQGQIEQELAIANGQRVRARLIISPSQQAVQAARSEVTGVANPADRSARFAVLAQRISTDASADRGGLIDSLSLTDPAVPSALRSTLPGLLGGDCSSVIALEKGFALVLVEEVLAPASLTREQATLRAQTRLQRVAMDRLAKQLLGASTISPLESGLAWSWEQR